MMAKYSGLCVGGPKAGQFYSWDSGYFVTQSITRIPAMAYSPSDPENDPMATVPSNRVYYKWLRGIRCENGDLNFWVVDDGRGNPPTVDDALGEVVSGYRALNEAKADCEKRFGPHHTEDIFGNPVVSDKAAA